MAAVYSTKLAAVNGIAGGPVTIFTCPPGVTAVVKCIALTLTAAAAASGVWIAQLPDAVILASLQAGSVSPFATSLLNGTWTLEVGQQLTIQTYGTATGQAYVSGYLLALP